MARTAGRTPARTRQKLLDAAATVIRKRGTGATLDDIAAASGVSKGGLLYHFSTKDELFQALASNLFQEFRQAVHAAVEPADTSPGRLTRAYIRASMDTRGSQYTLRDELILTAQLMTHPGIAEIARAESEQWNAELRADGLSEETRALAVAAADGIASASIWGDVTSPDERDRLQQRLLALTYDPTLWTPPGT